MFQFLFNNISTSEIPSKIKSIIRLGSGFVLLKPNKTNSLQKIVDVYLTIIKKKKTDDNNFMLNLLYSKYTNLCYKFYKRYHRETTKMIRLLERFSTENNLIVKEADKNLSLTIMPYIWYHIQSNEAITTFKLCFRTS